MTAFASADLTTDVCSVTIEIRGYNSRSLDMAIKIPQQYLAIEDKLRRAVAEQVTRGRIELKLTIQDSAENAEIFRVNQAMATSYFDALTQLNKSLNLKHEIQRNINQK